MKISPMKKKASVIKQFRIFDFHMSDKYEDDVEDDVEDETNNKKPQKTSHIQLFGINELGETASITITDYCPFFFIHLPLMKEKVKEKRWTQSDVDELRDYIFKKIWAKADILSVHLVEYQKLYGFSAGKKDQFAQITFRNQSVFKQTQGLWYEYIDNQRVKKPFYFKNVNLSLYESSILPLLRYFHIQNISPSGWISVKTTSMQNCITKKTTCKYEYIGSKQYVTPLPTKETAVPYKICSFDIEASSSHGDFPIPIKTYKRLATNILETIDIYKKIDISRDTFCTIIRKMILTAFGHETMDRIDLVYPKEKWTKEQVEKQIDIFLNTQIDKIVVSSTMQESMRIESFMSMRIDNTTEEGPIKEEDDGDDIDDDDDANVKDNDAKKRNIAKRNDTKKTDAKKTDVNVKKTTDAKRNTIYDILIPETIARDEKMQKLNELLMTNFPNLEGDKVTFIGSTFLRYGESEPYLNHCLALGTCNSVAGATIEIATTEADLLVQWSQLIQRENPDIIIGYNIFGFDYPFMFSRAKENGYDCLCAFLELSRIKNHISAKKGTGEYDVTKYELDKTSIKLATGEYELFYPVMIGRLQIDLLGHFRKNENLSSYKLDDVAGHCIHDTIHDIQLPEIGIVDVYTDNIKGLHINDYIHIEISEFTTDYFRNGQKFLVHDILPDTTTGKKILRLHFEPTSDELCVLHSSENSQKVVSWALAKDDVSPQNIFILTNGSDSDRAIVAKYCIQDCNIVQHLMLKTDLLSGLIEMASICSVPMNFLVLRGQGIKLTSFVAKECRNKGILMPDLEKLSYADGYEGAIVLDPKTGIYLDNPVACSDFSSLYPSIMISNNYSHDSLTWTKEFDLEGNLLRESGVKDSTGKYIYDNVPGYEYINTTFDTYSYIKKNPTSKHAKKIISGKMTCRWAQFPDGKKGVLPTILEEILAARKQTRQRLKTEKDEFMANILNQRQLALKVTANSIYGQCGAKTSTFYEKSIAASTTATGRMMIMYVKKMVETIYADTDCQTKEYGMVHTRSEYVYGDTDSVFYTFNLEDPVTKQKIVGKKALKITIELAQEFSKMCTMFLMSPMELCYEKTLTPFGLVSKKRYFGMLYEFKTELSDCYLKIMGLQVKKRDSCDYFKDTYGGILNIFIGNGQTEEYIIREAVKKLQFALQQLVDGEVPIDKLTITKSLRSDYANPKTIGHKVLADRVGERDPGNRPKPGDRISYAFIETANPKALVGDRIETPEFIALNEKKIRIDYAYYITNQLMNPLLQLFGLILEKLWEYNAKTGLLKTFRKKMSDAYKACDGDLEIYNKIREKETSTHIKQMLFDPFLVKINNKRLRLQTITSMFS